MQYVIKSGGQFLKDLGRWHSVWVSNRYEAKHYVTRGEADVVAFAIEAEVAPVFNEA